MFIIMCLESVIKATYKILKKNETDAHACRVVILDKRKGNLR